MRALIESEASSISPSSLSMATPRLSYDADITYVGVVVSSSSSNNSSND